MHLDKTVVKLKIKEFSPEREKLLYLIIVVYIVKFFFLSQCINYNRILYRHDKKWHTININEM